MRRLSRHSFIFCLIAALAILPVVANYALAADAATEENDIATEENDTSLATVGVDLLAVRPLGIASTVLGLVGYAISLPFSIPGGNSDKVWENCVVKPANYTFKRPIGEF